MTMANQEAYCTLVMTDSYLPGAAVLAKSLRDAGTTRKLAVMVTLESLHPETVSALKSLYDYVLPVDQIANRHPRNLYLLDRPDLLYSFTKLNVWRQTQFSKVVYLDADVLALRAPDELFDLNHHFAAAPDVGWPDIFNSGVMLLKPNMGEFWALQNLASCGDSFDGADQGLLNQYFEHKNGHRLSFRYNCTPSASYQYEPAYRHYKSGISLAHFIGNEKPWSRGRPRPNEAGAYLELLNNWWAVYDKHYRASVASRVVQSHVNDDLVVSDVEPLPSDLSDSAEDLEVQEYESAPSTQWDATRAPPPAGSHPEAANLPSHTYEFNQSTSLFRAPKSYPEPPGNLSWDLPRGRTRTDQPSSIFPWEEREPIRPSRVFPEDFGSPDRGFGSSQDADVRPKEPTTPRITVSLDDGTTRSDKVSRMNAWDEIAEIDDYVRKYSQMQKLRGSLQVLSNSMERHAQSPTDPDDPETPEHKESMVVTDFPTAIERPSLPVTPAPIRRPMFWGGERNERGDLPSAQGVPNQADWDPTRKLEELRQQSLAMDPDILTMPAKTVAMRQVPESSTRLLADLQAAWEGSPAEGQLGYTRSDSPLPRRSSPVLRSKVSFGSVDPTSEGHGSPKNDNLSPTRQSPTRRTARSIS